MASSNRHWPSLFKSKPCSTRHHHQWQHDMNHSSLLAAAGQHHSPLLSCEMAEERSPEPKPKPRWNPKPEQIGILESIFNSGMVNPPRDEIRKIRAQLQEYGEVGDANVFYWFQNRKSRSKHKQRHHLQSARSQAPRISAAPAAIATSVAPPGPTSSSSGSAGSDKFLPMVSVSPAGMMEAPPVSTSRMVYCQAPLAGFLVEPFYLQGTQAFSFSSSVAAYPEQFGVSMGTPASKWSEVMLGGEGGSEVMLGGEGGSINGGGVTERTKVDNKLENPNPSFVAASLGGTITPISKIQAEPATAGIGGAARSMVFINEDAFEVMAGPLNIREAFGEEAILIHSSGHPVLTDQWGLTLHPLQHGASYYLV